jgi:hypothetical protein
MTPHNHDIVDCGAFCEVIFFCILSKNLLEDFSDSLAIYLLFWDHPKCLDLISVYLSGLMQVIIHKKIIFTRQFID